MGRAVKIIAVQLEPCHANTDGSAWYAYVEGSLDDMASDLGKDGVTLDLEDLVKKTGLPLGIDCTDWEEVPNDLSRYARLKRYYVGGAV